MDPTLFAAFRDPNEAEYAFNALLDLGVQPEDLSLIVNEHARGGPPPGRELEFEGTTDLDTAYDPAVALGLANMDVGEVRIEEEISDRFESRIGGGISTSNPDDAAESIDQMDDGQSAAEDMIHPEGERSYGSAERHDVAEGATTGFFNTTRPEGSSLTGNELDAGPTVAVDSIVVEGLGRVLGDGALATSATGAAIAASAAGRSAAEISDYLVDAGVPASQVDDLREPFTRGGAILTATIRPGDASIDQAEETISRFCPQVVRTYNDIPEPNG